MDIPRTPFDEWEAEHRADLDFDGVSPQMIGRKWLVVVDYHN